MLTKDAIAHFGSQAGLARALNIKPPSVADWGETVPPLRQLQLEALTGGKLRAAASILPASVETERAA
jgi:DNA-binding transcriptional regulator YdaS (Cro superfamily)